MVLSVCAVGLLFKSRFPDDDNDDDDDDSDEDEGKSIRGLVY